jgi:hypothetical protein
MAFLLDKSMFVDQMEHSVAANVHPNRVLPVYRSKMQSVIVMDLLVKAATLHAMIRPGLV